jgi:polyphosphate glucokinase
MTARLFGGFRHPECPMLSKDQTTGYRKQTIESCIIPVEPFSSKFTQPRNLIKKGTHMQILGIDIGGSGIKGALVDTVQAELLTERYRLPTPDPSTPAAVAQTVAMIVQQFGWQGQIGCGFPAVVRHGVVRSAANIHSDWVNTNAAKLFSENTGCPTTVINDADAAGMAEIHFGAGSGRSGVIMVVTIGTGLGTALFVDGKLVPNLELGHIEIRGKDAERRASDAARQRKKLSWENWAVRFNEYLLRLEALVNPDLFILGGGGSKGFNRFRDHLTISTEVIPAQFLNEAGIVGAAFFVAQQLS